MRTRVHLYEALDMLRSGGSYDLGVWKSSGEKLLYRNAVYTSHSFKAGTMRVKLLTSGQVRSVSFCCLFSINGYEIFL